MQDLYNDISSSDDDDEDETAVDTLLLKDTTTPSPTATKSTSPTPKIVSDEDRKALDELYKEESESGAGEITTSITVAVASQQTTTAKLNEVGS